MTSRAAKYRTGMGARLESILLLGGIISLFGLYSYYPEGVDDGVIWTCLGIAYATLLRALFRPAEIIPGRKSYLTIELIFILGYYAVFYWEYQGYILGVSDVRFNYFLQNTYANYTNPAIILSTIGLLSFLLGYREFGTERASAKPRRSIPRFGQPVPHLQIALLGLIAGLIALYVAAGWQSDAVGRYTDSVSGGAAANGVYNIIVMLCVIVAADIVYALAHRRISPISIACGVIAMGWSLYILVMGDRNSFFIIAAAAAGGIMTYLIRGNRLAILGALAGSLLVYNFIEVYRMQPDAPIEEVAVNVFLPSPTVADRDSSFSISTINTRAAIAISEQYGEFGYGKYQLIGFGGIIPFIRGMILGDDRGFTDTAQVLTYYVLGPNSTWGVGTNLIADLYLDLGMLGVVLGLFCIGAFAGKMEISARLVPGSQAIMIFYVLTFAYYSEYARYNFSFPVTSLVWAAALVFGLYTLFSSESLKQFQKLRQTREKPRQRLTSTQDRAGT